jgi:hypothetical protein
VGAVRAVGTVGTAGRESLAAASRREGALASIIAACVFSTPLIAIRVEVVAEGLASPGALGSRALKLSRIGLARVRVCWSLPVVRGEALLGRICLRLCNRVGERDGARVDRANCAQIDAATRRRLWVSVSRGRLVRAGLRRIRVLARGGVGGRGWRWMAGLALGGC